MYCFAEGLLVQATMQHTGFAFLHMEFNVKGPVVAGDTIHVECEVIEARRSRTGPAVGWCGPGTLFVSGMARLCWNIPRCV